ncbi:MAG TPA: ABC transporter permease subunit [Pseudonocardiaceae bacterium]
MNLVSYVLENADTIFFYGEQHFLVVLIATALGSAISVVFALLVSLSDARPGRWFVGGIREGALVVTAAALTVPSLALFVLLLPLFGLGAATTITALTIYSLYTVLRNSVTGLSSVDSAVLESAKGLGMGRVRRLVRIQLPLAWPVILNGIRVATLINIAIAAVAALVRGPGLGQLVLTGLSRYGAANALNQVLVGTLGCLVVAAVFEIFYAIIQRLTVPRGIRV